MADNRAGAFLGGLLLGAAVGTVVGLLIAPRSGQETRRFLRKSAKALPEVAEDMSSNLHSQTERLLDAAQKNLDETLARLQEAITTGKAAMVQKRFELTQQRLQAEDQEAQHLENPSLTLADEPSSATVAATAPLSAATET